MPLRLLGVLVAAIALTGCGAGADYPDFVDSTVRATTGVDLEADAAQHAEENRVDESTDGRTAQRTPRRAQSTPTPSTASHARSIQDLLNLYANWTALIVAADYRTGQGNPTDAFDNSRRAIAGNLAQLGFEPRNTGQLSVRPQRYGDPRVYTTSFDNIDGSLGQLRPRAPGGCFVYLTSHGSPNGIVLGEDGILTPAELDGLLDAHCGQDLTILIVSACYSGIFASEEMQAPNRFIMTAARSDRSSFGCGEGDTFPYFDQCVIESFGRASDWLDLARQTRGCVEARERSAHLSPPSSPQVFAGSAIRDFLLNPFISVNYGPPTSGS